MALFVALASQGIAHAAPETFQFSFAGTGTHLWNWYECTSHPNEWTCDDHGYLTPLVWNGTVSVTVPTNESRVFGGSEVLSFSFASNLVDFARFEFDQVPSVEVEGERLTFLASGGNPLHPGGFVDNFRHVFLDGSPSATHSATWPQAKTAITAAPTRRQQPWCQCPASRSPAPSP